MKIDKIVINKIEKGTKVKAYVSFVLNDCFAVHDARIIDGKKGLFIAMPSKKYNDGFKDVCHPTNQEFREELEKKIFDEYQNV